MKGNADFSCADTAVVSLVAVDAPIVVSSDDFDARLASFLGRTGMRKGMLQALAGISERRHWAEGTSPIDGAVEAGAQAIELSGISRSRIGLLIDTSVSRQRLEPSSAVSVHSQIGLPSSCINFDLSNACLGFVSGIQVASLMIESGQIDYALIVDSESSNELQNTTIERLLDASSTANDFISNFASLTLGSGATAMVLGRHSRNPGSHRIIGGLFRAETKHHDLCVGSIDEMRTDAPALLKAGNELAKLAWEEAGISEWNDMDCYIIHQVSRVHTAAIVKTLDIDISKVPQLFEAYGNMGPAAIPFTLAKTAESLNPGDKVICLGIGSGLNCAVIELVW